MWSLVKQVNNPNWRDQTYNKKKQGAYAHLIHMFMWGPSMSETFHGIVICNRIQWLFLPRKCWNGDISLR